MNRKARRIVTRAARAGNSPHNARAVRLALGRHKDKTKVVPVATEAKPEEPPATN